MDHTGMAVWVHSVTGLPPEVLTFTVESGGEEMTYRRESQERPGMGWHAHYESSALRVDDGGGDPS